MTTQLIVNPDQIEPELIKIWETLAKENKMRASLFNLIVFTRLNERADYFRTIVQKIVEKFPCRTLFISHDEKQERSYIKTAISVVFPSKEESTIACDQIDIGVGGHDLERVPFVILPHLIPDLPVYLLWAEDPSIPHPLFDPLAKLATRVIFDSESTDSLPSFAKTVIDLKEEKGVDVADLNWARTEKWRDLIASIFSTPGRIADLEHITRVGLTYNQRSTEFFCHLKVQALYIIAWLSSRLSWKLTTHIHNVIQKLGIDEEGSRDFLAGASDPCQRQGAQRGRKISGKADARQNQFLDHVVYTSPLNFIFTKQSKSIQIAIQSENWDKLGPGILIKTQIETTDQHLYDMARSPSQPSHVNIQISTPQKCDLPYQFTLGQTAAGQSLVKEICTKGTSQHYLDTLHQILTLHKGDL